MSIPFFNSVLAALGKRVNYDAVVNYAGNSFAKDSWKLIQEANPLIPKGMKKSRGAQSFVDLLNQQGTSQAAVAALGDMSWAN